MKTKGPSTPFFIIVLIIIIPFIISRLYFYLLFPQPGIISDTTGYYAPVWQALHGISPSFDFRNPGYPMLMLGAMLLSGKLLHIVYLQSLLSLASSLFFLKEWQHFFPRKTWIFAVGISLFLISDEYILLESSLQSEIAFTSFIWISLALMLRYFRKESDYAGLLPGLALAFTILIRPAGIFLLPLWLSLLWWKQRQNKGMRSVILGVLSLLFPLLFTMTYNQLEHGRFSLAQTAAVNQFGAVMPYIQTSPDFHPRMNAAINHYLKRINQAERQSILRSGDRKEIIAVYTQTYEEMWGIYQHIRNDSTPPVLCYQAPLSCLFPEIRKVAHHSIRENPGFFLKMSGVSLAHSLIRHRVQWTGNYVDVISQRCTGLHPDNVKYILDPSKAENQDLLQGLQRAGSPCQYDGGATILDTEKPKRGTKAWWAGYTSFIGWLLFFNRGYIWTLLITVAFFVSLKGLRKTSKPKLMMTGLLASWAIYMGMTHLFVYPLQRITFPLEWISLFALAFLLMKLMDKIFSHRGLLTVAIPVGRKSSTLRI